MSRSWLINHRVQMPTVSVNALNRSYSLALYASTSIVLHITPTYKDLYRA